MISTIAVGPVTLHMYGLFLGLAIAVGWWWAVRLVQRVKGDIDDFERVALAAIGGGIVGARLYHVADYWWYYSQHVNEILFLWQGGLGIWGAIGGGVVGIVLTCWGRWKQLLLYLNAIASAMPLAQAIGRWGNWVNHELFGKPTTLPWRWYIPFEYRPQGMENIVYYHPLFLYESLLSLCLFLGMWWLERKRLLRRGQALGGYLIGYGVIRFVLEPFRISPWVWGVFPVAQLMSVMAIGIGGWWWWRCRICS